MLWDRVFSHSSALISDIYNTGHRGRSSTIQAGHVRKAGQIKPAICFSQQTWCKGACILRLCIPHCNRKFLICTVYIHAGAATPFLSGDWVFFGNAFMEVYWIPVSAGRRWWIVQVIVVESRRPVSWRHLVPRLCLFPQRDASCFQGSSLRFSKNQQPMKIINLRKTRNLHVNVIVWWKSSNTFCIFLQTLWYEIIKLISKDEAKNSTWGVLGNMVTGALVAVPVVWVFDSVLDV